MKFDALQPSDSFKERGVGAACTNKKIRTGPASFPDPAAMPASPLFCRSHPRHSRDGRDSAARASSRAQPAGTGRCGGHRPWLGPGGSQRIGAIALDDMAAFLHPFLLGWTCHADRLARAGASFDGVVLFVGGDACYPAWPKDLRRRQRRWNGGTAFRLRAASTVGAGRAEGSGAPAVLVAIREMVTFVTEPQPKGVRGEYCRLERILRCLRLDSRAKSMDYRALFEGVAFFCHRSSIRSI